MESNWTYILRQSTLILKLLITSEMASRYTCYFCNGRNLENVDFLQKELHNIDFWQNVQEKI